MDTAGQGAWRGEDTQLQWADAVLVVFSVTSVRSLSVAADILCHLKKVERREGQEMGARDRKGRERENQEQAGSNEDEFIEKSKQGREHEDEKVNTEEEGRGLDAQIRGTGGENSDVDKAVEGKLDMGKPESVGDESNLFKSRNQTYGSEPKVDHKEISSNTTLSPIPSSTHIEDYTGEPNELNLCQGLAGVASLRKLAMARVTGSQKNNDTNACPLPEYNTPDWEEETQGEEGQTSNHLILIAEGYRNIEVSENCSKMSVANTPESLVEFPRKTRGETGVNSSMKSTGVSECNPPTTDGQQQEAVVRSLSNSLCCRDDTTGKTFENTFSEMNLGETNDIEDNKFFEGVQNTSNARSEKLNNTVVNKIQSIMNEENNRTLNPITLLTCLNSSDSSISDDKKYFKDDSLPQEKKSTISSQTTSFSIISPPLTGVSDMQTSTEESTTSSPTNIDKKELAEDPTFRLCKETVLLGNKSDLEHRREVSTAQGAAVAEQYHCHYKEIAASAPWEVVSEPFIDLYRQVLEVRNKKLQSENCDNTDKSEH